jgi:hypothetical protein
MAAPKKPAQKPPPKVVRPVVKVMAATPASPSVKLPFPNADTAREKMGLHLPGDEKPQPAWQSDAAWLDARPVDVPGARSGHELGAGNRGLARDENDGTGPRWSPRGRGRNVGQGGGPTPAASAVEHANPNARFKRGPGKPKGGPSANARRSASPHARLHRTPTKVPSKPVRESKT